VLRSDPRDKKMKSLVELWKLNENLKVVKVFSSAQHNDEYEEPL